MRALVALGALAGVLAIAPAAGAAPISVTAAAPVTPGPLSAAQQRVLSQGYLVPDQAAYDSAKRAAAGRAPQPTPEANLSGPFTPVTGLSFAGQRDTNVAPPDTTGAV